MNKLFNIFFGLLCQGFALPRNDLKDFTRKSEYLHLRNDVKGK